MKIVVSSLLLIVLACGLALAADLDFEGLLGMRWADSLLGRADLTQLYTVRGSTTAYAPEHAPQSFMGLRVDDVTIWGCSERLFGATVVLADPADMPALKRELVTLLGPPAPTSANRGELFKDGVRARVDERTSSVYITHEPTREQYCPPPQAPQQPIKRPINR